MDSAIEFRIDPLSETAYSEFFSDPLYETP
jgi:hypothetical protein